MTHDDFELSHRHFRVAQLYLRGKTQAEIAHTLGVSQPTISRDLADLRESWLADSKAAVDQVRAEQLAKIDRLEAAAWEGFDKSQQDAETRREEEIEGGKGPRKKTVTQTRGQAGESRYLRVILECVARRCAILGMDAPQKVQHSGTVKFYAGFTLSDVMGPAPDTPQTVNPAA